MNIYGNEGCFNSAFIHIRIWNYKGKYNASKYKLKLKNNENSFIMHAVVSCISKSSCLKNNLIEITRTVYSFSSIYIANCNNTSKIAFKKTKQHLKRKIFCLIISGNLFRYRSKRVIKSKQIIHALKSKVEELE